MTRSPMISRVQFTDSGRPFVPYLMRKVSGEVVTTRRYGEIRLCIRCGAKYFHYNRGSGFCSVSCARTGKPGKNRGIPVPRRMTKASGRAKADQLFSLAVRSRGVCERCGEANKSKLQCAHIVSRRYYSTRWDWDNAFCLCAPCHWKGTNNPLWWDDFVISKIGEKTYADLKRRARKPLHPTTETYMTILGRLEQLLEWRGLLKGDDEVVTPRILARRFLGEPV